MVVLLIIAMTVIWSMPLLQQQVANREIDLVARRFIAHAQFARQQALYLGAVVGIEPRAMADWSSGWAVKKACRGVSQVYCHLAYGLSHPKTHPIVFRESSKRFIDPGTGRVGIWFNPAGAAKTAHGGFVANRLILGHQKSPGIERHVILGGGGRWRICDPAKDARRCH
jgi:type IV fimbrial biogenesis protein FimT